MVYIHTVLFMYKIKVLMNFDRLSLNMYECSILCHIHLEFTKVTLISTTLLGT